MYGRPAGLGGRQRLASPQKSKFEKKTTTKISTIKKIKIKKYMLFFFFFLDPLVIIITILGCCFGYIIIAERALLLVLFSKTMYLFLHITNIKSFLFIWMIQGPRFFFFFFLFFCSLCLDDTEPLYSSN